MDNALAPPTIKRKIPAAAIWILVILGGLLIVYSGNLIGRTIQTNKLNAAAVTAPAFSLTLFEGQEILTLADLKGQGVVVNFWASWCIPCRDEMPALEKAYQRYRDVGVVFIGVNLWDEEDKARAFLAEHGVSYPNGMDIADKIADAYNLQGIPTTWFISPDGTVARKALGPVDLDMLDEAIALIRPKQ